MNNTHLIGRLTATPELRKTTNEVEICSFTLAVPRTYKVEGQPEADFINCVAFKNNAKLINQYVAKGHRLAITGRIATRNYENDQGNKVYVTEVIVSEITFLEPKKEESKTTEDSFESVNNTEILEDDLPF